MERSTLRTSTPGPTVSTVGAKLRMLRDPDRDHLVGDVLGRGGRRRDHADGHALLADDLGQVAEGAHVDTGDDLLMTLRVGVEERDDAEAAATEAGVVRQRMTQVSDARR